MKRVILLIAAVVVLISISYAQEEVKATKEYFPLAKGNVWEYKVKEKGGEKDGKLEITEKLGEGRFKVELTNMGEGTAASIEWCVEGEFLCTKVQGVSGIVSMRMLKLGAKKGDSWTTAENQPENKERRVRVWNCTIEAVEEVSTPAGVFKDCLKVVASLSWDSSTVLASKWLAKGVGLVKQTLGPSDGTPVTTLILTKYKIVGSPNPREILEWLKESETALLVEVTSVTDVKPEREGEAMTKVKVAAKVEKSLKGKSSQTELSLEMAVGSIKVGKFVLFFKKGEKGDVILGEPVEATESNLKVIDEILNPPKFADTISDASLVIAGKVITCEDRGTFKYYVVEVIKVFKGEKKEFIDVYRTEGLDLENGKIYLFALKPTVVSGRSYFEPVKSGAVVLHSEEIEKQVESALKNQKEK